MEKVKDFLLKNIGLRQMIVKNTFWVTTGIVLTKIIRVVIIIYAARILGTENYGIFTYTASLIAVLAIFSDVGMTSILTRELARRTNDRAGYFSTALLVKLGFLIITIALISVFGPLIAEFDASKPLIIIMAITLAFESLQGFLYSITRAQNKMEVEAGLSVVTEIITTLIILGVFIKYPSIKSLTISYMIGGGLGLIITGSILRQYLRSILKNFKRKFVRPIISASWPFAIMGISGVLMTNIDSIIIGIYSNPHILGLYAAAQKPIGLLHVLPNFLSIGLFQVINKFSHEQDKKRLSIVMKKSSLASLALALPIVLGGIVIAEPLINITFGHQFIGAAPTLQILLISLLLVFPGSMLSDLILAENKQRVFVKSSILGAVTNIVLDLLLIPTYGIVGSAIATVIALLVVNGILFIEVKKITELKIMGDLWKMLLSAIIMMIITYILTTLFVPLIVIILLSAIIYFGLLFLMKEELIRDIQLSFTTHDERVS